jgi:hypothetical protein
MRTKRDREFDELVGSMGRKGRFRSSCVKCAIPVHVKQEQKLKCFVIHFKTKLARRIVPHNDVEPVPIRNTYPRRKVLENDVGAVPIGKTSFFSHRSVPYLN